jgi:hypothetical protein
MQCHRPWLVAPFERLSGVKPSLALRKNPSLLLVVVHLDDMRMECGMQQVDVDGAGPTRWHGRHCCDCKELIPAVMVVVCSR